MVDKILAIRREKCGEVIGKIDESAFDCPQSHALGRDWHSRLIGSVASRAPQIAHGAVFQCSTRGKPVEPRKTSPAPNLKLLDDRKLERDLPALFFHCQAK